MSLFQSVNSSANATLASVKDLTKRIRVVLLAKLCLYVPKIKLHLP